jgi:hypothetical protein
MRMMLLSLSVGGAVLCGLCLAQDARQAPAPPARQAQSAPSGQPAGPPRIAAGSVIPVELTKTVDAKKAKTGEEVEAKVTEDLKAENGQILMPKDTKIVGRVTEAQARTKQQKESELGIAFDHAILKAGETMPVPASIQAVIAPPSLNPDNAGSGSMPSQAPSGGMSPSSSMGRSGGMAGAPPQAPPSSLPATGNESSNPPNGNARPAITSKTEGVIGLSNYKLSNSGTAPQGSVVSSDKSNVKLESGTLMLLRVNQ